MKTNKPKICVVGSSNIDLVVKSQRLPFRGETILGGEFLMVPGGKGANQAVAAAKLGAEVYFVAKLGEDIFGTQSFTNFKKEGVNTKYVTRTNKALSGVASIAVDKAGNNTIVVAPGANHLLMPQDVKRAESAIASCGAIVAQLEIPVKTVEFAAALAKKLRIPFILDPAPAQKLSRELLKMTDVIKPNETEAQILTGIEVTDARTAGKAAGKLMECGVKTVIITMGAKGCFVVNNEINEFFPAKKVKAVDSTAAGDAFVGGLAFCIAQGQTILEAVLFANNVAALSVTKIGAQSSMPSMKEVEKFIKLKKQK
ncbi:MAG: ribokinase [Sedimentisphaerales bacterium]|jgi:ribokinase